MNGQQWPLPHASSQRADSLAPPGGASSGLPVIGATKSGLSSRTSFFFLLVSLRKGPFDVDSSDSRLNASTAPANSHRANAVSTPDTVSITYTCTCLLSLWCFRPAGPAFQHVVSTPPLNANHKEWSFSKLWQLPDDFFILSSASSSSISPPEA